MPDILITYCNNLGTRVNPEPSEGPLLVLAPLEVGPRLAADVLVVFAAVGAHERVARLLAPGLDAVLVYAALPPLRVVPIKWFSLPNLKFDLNSLTFRLVLNKNLFHGAAPSLDLVCGQVLEEDGVAVPAEVLVVLRVGHGMPSQCHTAMTIWPSVP